MTTRRLLRKKTLQRTLLRYFILTITITQVRSYVLSSSISSYLLLYSVLLLRIRKDMMMWESCTRRLYSSLMILIQQLQLQSLWESSWMRKVLSGMRHGLLQLRQLPTLTIQLWLRLLKNGQSSCSQDFFLEFTRLLKRLTEDLLKRLRLNILVTRRKSERWQLYMMVRLKWLILP